MGRVPSRDLLFVKPFPSSPEPFPSVLLQLSTSDLNSGAIIIACLGLLGLTAFSTHKRLLEISIRKVLGATTGNITSLLSRDLPEVVAIAGIISLPVVWYAASAWLNAFACRIDLTWDIFTLPVIALTLMCLLTVTAHIIRGINVNAANALKSE